MASNWALAPCDDIRRTQLHSKYGGRQPEGISPSTESPKVFLSSDAASGLKHGYVAHSNGYHFRYTGEGQRGTSRWIRLTPAIIPSSAAPALIQVRWFRHN